MRDRGPTIEEAGGSVRRPKCQLCERRGVARTASGLRWSTYEELFTVSTQFVYVCGSHR